MKQICSKSANLQKLGSTDQFCQIVQSAISELRLSADQAAVIRVIDQRFEETEQRQ